MTEREYLMVQALTRITTALESLRGIDPEHLPIGEEDFYATTEMLYVWQQKMYAVTNLTEDCE